MEYPMSGTWTCILSDEYRYERGVLMFAFDAYEIM